MKKFNMRPTKYRINLTGSEQAELEKIIRQHTAPQNEAGRARIILLANEKCCTNQEIAKQPGIHSCDITRWTKRWVDLAMEPVRKRLGDAPRPGAPDRITAEQWRHITALACEPPESFRLPITNWTHNELAKEAVRQGIVENVSSGHLGTVLKKRSATSSKPLPVEFKT
jgi:putative transposase